MAQTFSPKTRTSHAGKIAYQIDPVIASKAVVTCRETACSAYSAVSGNLNIRRKKQNFYRLMTLSLCRERPMPLA